MAGEMFFEGLDDEVQFEISNNFAGGMVSNMRPILLQPNQVQYFQNIDLSLAGDATTRRGSIQLDGIVGGVSNPAGVQGMFWYSTSANEYLVAVNNAKLYNWNGAAWTNFGAAWTSTDTGAMTYFAQLSNKLYFCNGASGGSANLFSWDGTTLTDLGNAANNQPPATPGLVCEHTNRLVVVGTGANRNTLYFSQFLDGTIYDKTKWTIQIGDNDAIVAIKSWTNFNLIVFKRHSVWAVNCDPTLQIQDTGGTIQFFEVKPIHRSLGCIAPLSVQQVGNDIFFLSQHGIYSINMLVAANAQTEISTDLSYPIHDYIERINLANASKSAAIGYGNKYLLSVPLDNNTAPSHVIVWNDALRVFSGVWTGWNASCFAYSSPATGNLLRFGTATGGGLVNEWLDYIQVGSEGTSTFQDAGVDIPCTVTTRSYTFGGIANRKTPWGVRTDFFNSLASPTLSIQIDKRAVQQVGGGAIPGAGGTGITFPLSFPILFPAIKSFPFKAALQQLGQFTEAFFVLSSTAKKLNLNSLSFGAWIDTVDAAA